MRKSLKRPVTAEEIKEGDIVFLPGVGMCRVHELFMDEYHGDHDNDWHVLAFDICGGLQIARATEVRLDPPSNSTLTRLRAKVQSRIAQGKVNVAETTQSLIYFPVD